MRPFTSSFGNLCILLIVDYVSKWVEVAACPKNDANTVLGFLLRNILSRFGAPELLLVMEEAIFQTRCLRNS